jgi:hypothetical protein
MASNTALAPMLPATSEPLHSVKALLARPLTAKEGWSTETGFAKLINVPIVPAEEEAFILTRPEVVAAFADSMDAFEAWEKSL